MASSKEYLDYILEQLEGTEEISWRAMMGEYILYYKGRVFGGIYDDRFLVKPVESALALLPEAVRELPYEGGREMLLIDEPENRALLRELIERMYAELPPPKKRGKN